jgi:hypothetical protein
VSPTIDPYETRPNADSIATYYLSDLSTLFLMSFILPTVNGRPAIENPVIQRECAKGDHYLMGKPIHRQCTNIYKTRDGRWYHLHGSMNATPSMKMLGVIEDDVSHEEARNIIKEKVAQWKASELETVSNDQFGQAGVVCLTPEEFFCTNQVYALPEADHRVDW